MNTIYLLLAIILAAPELSAQVSHDIRGPTLSRNNALYEPLLLYTDGPGRFFPFHDGQMLQVGRNYEMIAVPKWGYVFTHWTPVDVFTITEITYGPDGNPLPPTVSTIVSPEQEVIRKPVLRFAMQPVEVILDFPGVRNITLSRGWEAHFAAIRLSWPRR